MLLPGRKPVSSEITEVTTSEAIVVDRMQHYGHPRDNFRRAATMLKAYIYAKYGVKINLTEEDIPQMMILVKQARLMNGYHADSVEDQAGYAKTHHMVVQEAAKEIDWNINNDDKGVQE